ncbi:MAG: hypothetical protein KKD90_05185 [Candidatus Omnitrophica bacterium]|nr:hypothetical protein [Candidatus Omnitrophota bacterium]MBU4149550.1 hypothetical protein [Candidatus Omnitrophota bacterium]
MIEIEFSSAIAIFIFLTVFIVFVIWLFTEKKKALGLLSPESRFLWQCNICTYVYIDSRHNAISQCPRCNSYNKKSSESA